MFLLILTANTLWGVELFKPRELRGGLVYIIGETIGCGIGFDICSSPDYIIRIRGEYVIPLNNELPMIGIGVGISISDLLNKLCVWYKMENVENSVGMLVLYDGSRKLSYGLYCTLIKVWW